MERSVPNADPAADFAASIESVQRANPDIPTGASPPDWSQIDDDIDCPLCGYLLRGLIEPRCPECGYRFEWAALLAAQRGRHPYLFEHHPERNIRSCLHTFFGALRPVKFWSGLHPAQQQDARRLLIYAAVPYALMFPVWFSLLAVDVKMTFASMTTWTTTVRAQQAAFFSSNKSNQYVKSMTAKHGSITAYLDSYFPMPTASDALQVALIQGQFGLRLLAGLLCLLLWSAATLNALLIFQVSMRRARLRTIHIARCVVYSFDLLAWWLLVLIVLSAVLRPLGVLVDASKWLEDALSSLLALSHGAAANRAMILRTLGIAATSPWSAVAGAAAMLVSAAVCLYCIARLAIAYRRYLQFHAPVAVVVSSQILVVLAALVLVVQVYLFR